MATTMAATTATTAFPWDATLALVRWKQTRRGYDNDAQLVQTGFALLAPRSALLDAAEREFNVSWHRIVTEAVHFAIFQLTKARRDDAERPEQTTHALRLLRLALNVFATRKHNEAIAIPLNSSNLLLAAMADVLEKDATTQGSSSSDDELNVLLDVKHVFMYLFGLPATATSQLDSDAPVPSFQLYKPPTNVFTEFMHRALTVSLARLASQQQQPSANGNNGDGDDSQTTASEYVAFMRAVVGVFHELQRSQVNKRKVFLAVAKTSLRDVIGYRHALVELQTRGVAGVAAVVTLLDRIVVDALFDSEHIRAFDGALVHMRIWRQTTSSGIVDAQALAGTADGAVDAVDAKSNKKRRKHTAAVSTSGGSAPSALVSYQKNLFDELRAFLSDPSVSLSLKSAAGGLMEVLVDAFAQRIRAAAHLKIEDTKTDLKTSKKRAATVIATASTTYSPFKFWSELCAVAFVASQQPGASGVGADGDSHALLVRLYDSLFRALWASDVYRVTEDTDEREQFDAMETVLRTFVHLINTAATDARGGDTAAATPLLLVQRQCAVISSAVRCSPNLVNSSLEPIFEILGRHVRASSSSSDCAAVLQAAGDCVVDLVRSFESMRLLDKFLRAAMATRASTCASKGLYALVAHAQCESALRRAFMTLPPGQLDVLWTQFTHEFAAKYSAASTVTDDDAGDSADEAERIYALGLVRFVFQVFVQEVHVTPQTKSKVAALVAQTHTALFAPAVARLAAASARAAFDARDRECFALFGELLTFYDVLAAVRADTFDEILAALKQRGLSGAMQALLSGGGGNSAPTTPKGKKKAKTTKFAAAHRGLDSTGIIKLCVFWLRKATSIRHASSEVASAPAKELQRVAVLVVDHVIASKCWDAVAFYLPELLDAVAQQDKAQELLQELVSAYLSEESHTFSDGPATRIVRDAAFYEIRSFQAVAPSVFAALVRECSNALPSPAALERVSLLFAFLAGLPTSYLDVTHCSDLLLNALALHKTLAQASSSSSAAQQTLRVLLTWLQSHFKRIAAAVAAAPASDVRSRIDAGARFLFTQAAADGTSGVIAAPLLGGILSFYLSDISADAFVGELFRSLVLTKASPRDNLLRSALVVEALADLRLGGGKALARKVSTAEAEFIGVQTALLQQERVAASLDDSVAFVVLGALVKYHAATAAETSKSAKSDSAQPLPAILSSRLGATLVHAMHAVVGDARPREAWRFYTNFCHHFAALRPSVTLETYGCVLAVALTLVCKRELGADERTSAHRALQALVVHASKDEYRLLLATLSKELQAREPMRAVSALKALRLLLQGERKLSMTRRALLSSHKDAIVAALIENLGRSLAATTVTAVAPASCVELCTSTLQVFVLFFTKAELFAWSPHELAHVFIGFEPLLAVVAHWRARRFSRAQVHEIWMLSYTLLLRVVRHHFASLVNGTAHIVQAANALLQLLVLASADDADKDKDKDKDDGQTAVQCAEWSSNLARLYGYMKEHDAQLRKHVVYLLLAYLVGVTRDNLAVALQQKLRPGVFALLDICSLYEKEQLYAALDATGKSLLKSLDTSYKLTHRYVGKV